jgi:nucleotide-binding universal stress UspA family protein
MSGQTASIALRTHKPVLAVSERQLGFAAGGRALVAWDGSPAAAAAVTAAVPLLRLAADVLLFQAVADGDVGSAEEPAAYLSRHGIHSRIELVTMNRQERAELITQAARREGADYCVMGAYGHSRLREALLGGVTRRMLSTSQLPLVLAH